MDNMSALSPKKQSHVLTPRKLKTLVAQYSKVVDNIQSIGGMDKVKSEIDRYVMDDDVKEDISKEQGFKQFWTDVGKLMDAKAGWTRYEVLPRFALGMGTKNSATGDVERAFSTMNIIHQNKQRNAMSQDMLDAHMHIRSGVESKDNMNQCIKCCDPDGTIHCHCVIAEITEEMRQKCKKAWEKCKIVQKEASDEKKKYAQNNVEKKVKYEKAEADRVKKLKEDVTKRPNFYAPNLMKAMYPTEKKGNVKTNIQDNNEERKDYKNVDKRKKDQKNGENGGEKTKNSSKSGFSIPKKPRPSGK
jgi:hypothetical protein